MTITVIGLVLFAALLHAAWNAVLRTAMSACDQAWE
jgi:hypothetical protein